MYRTSTGVKVKVKVSFRRFPHVSFFLNRESCGNWVLYNTYSVSPYSCSVQSPGREVLVEWAFLS